MIELGLAAPNRVSKLVMQMHLDEIKKKYPDEIFSEYFGAKGEDDEDNGAMPLVQLSREDDYALQENALQLHLYLFGYNDLKSKTMHNLRGN